MSIRVALIGGLLLLLLTSAAVISIVGIQGIKKNVIREAQDRVNRDLETVISLYQDDLRDFADEMRKASGDLELSRDPAELAARIAGLRTRLDLSVLNLCDPEGRPLAGTYPDLAGQLAIARDPVLRRALSGRPAWGMVRLAPERLNFEGGPALLNQQIIVGPEGKVATESALMQWFAQPILDDAGRVSALLYGGRSFNHHYDRVNGFQRVVFGEEAYDGKPLGTVTFFLGPTRVATNVLDSEGRRAVGTTVSDEVNKAVLGRGQRWQSRAWVVDAWYISGYAPIRDPDGSIIGMLFVGLLEAPYDRLRARLVTRLLVPGAILLVVAVLVLTGLVQRITSPLEDLTAQSAEITRGDWPRGLLVGGSYREIDQLRRSFVTMQEAIQRRDGDLRASNEELGETNQALTEANANYMSTLAFVTHELKSPLAANQGLIDLLVEGQLGEMPESAREFLVRIKRNGEELQDMVKDYLDLSRAERGELQPTMERIDLCEDVVRPAMEQSQALFDSRGITLTADCKTGVELEADPELLRIALGNYLSNAAKYGREQGRARLELRSEDGQVELSVWNEGQGFGSAEAETLFGKFKRLKNDNTRGKRGSGLGLFLTRQILESHGGETWAESEPGRWARFGFRLPAADAV